MPDQPRDLDELSKIVGDSIIAQLATAAQRHNVAIHLTVMPHDPSTDEDEDDANDPV